jgi:hypothetical protein
MNVGIMIKLLLFLTGFFQCSALAAPEGNFLNIAVLELPDHYLADVPMADRSLLLRRLSESGGQLDYARGWLHFSSDEGPGGPGGTSMFYLKILPRKHGGNPLVFVHMAKPFADGSAPRANQTFVLAWDHGKWTDATAEVMPAGIDLTMHFRPCRKTGVIEAAHWVKVPRHDGRGGTYIFGPRTLDLVWNGQKFERRKPAGKILSVDAE